MSHILIVDDSNVIRKVAKRILAELRFDTTEACNGKEALIACRQHMPDGVLLDWNMPEMDGLEFLHRLRKLTGGDAPKVLFCTTNSQMQHIRKAIAAGANEYIMKPFDKEIIQDKFTAVGLL